MTLSAPLISQDRQRPVRLTRRELEVLDLIAAGNSSDEVAETLVISKRTIDFHLANIYGKLGVSNRLLAIRMVWRLGLLPFEPSFRGSLVATPKTPDGQIDRA